MATNRHQEGRPGDRVEPETRRCVPGWAQRDPAAPGSREGAQFRPRLESNRPHRPNLHRLLRVRIEAVARGTHRQCEGAEADERHLLVAAQPPLQCGQHGLRCSFRGGLGRAFAQNFLHCIYEAGLVHRVFKEGAERMNAAHAGQTQFEKHTAIAACTTPDRTIPICGAAQSAAPLRPHAPSPRHRADLSAPLRA